MLQLLVWTKLQALGLGNRQAVSQLHNRPSNVRRQLTHPYSIATQYSLCLIALMLATAMLPAFAVSMQPDGILFHGL